MSTITPGLIKKSTKHATKYGYNVVYLSVSIKHGLRTTDCGLGIKYGLVKCMVNKGTSSSSS